MLFKCKKVNYAMQGLCFNYIWPGITNVKIYIFTGACMYIHEPVYIMDILSGGGCLPYVSNLQNGIFWFYQETFTKYNFITGYLDKLVF